MYIKTYFFSILPPQRVMINRYLTSRLCNMKNINRGSIFKKLKRKPYSFPANGTEDEKKKKCTEEIWGEHEQFSLMRLYRTIHTSPSVFYKLHQSYEDLITLRLTVKQEECKLMWNKFCPHFSIKYSSARFLISITSDWKPLRFFFITLEYILNTFDNNLPKHNYGIYIHKYMHKCILLTEGRTNSLRFCS